MSVLRPETKMSTFAVDVRDGLASRPKSLPPKYFYDPLGSLLFEAICELPWYRITRAEKAILREHGSSLLAPLGARIRVVELGGGSGEKLEILLHAVEARKIVSADLVDLSVKALERAKERLATFPGVAFTAHHLPFHEGLLRAVSRRDELPIAVLFLGSNIGNFDDDGTRAFLASARAALRPGDGLLLGADLVKPERDLLLAYDDPLGVTAAFNKNVLVRMNAELGADFDPTAFDHRAVWNAARSRVEMHLVARRDVRVTIPEVGMTASFEADEPIVTEWSTKYTPEALAALLSEAGFRESALRVDHDARFTTGLFVAV